MALAAHDVSLDFHVYGHAARSLRRAMVRSLAIGGRMGQDHNTVVVRALNGVSFQLEEGDRLGLMGHNGSGKSTLLRTLAGIYKPTSGRVETRGTISTFFDVSLGLDLEASGRENIYLLGMYRGKAYAEIKGAFEEIVEFSGLGAFIDLPLKAYSAGMIGRMVFSVATAFQPDILLMDEWLSTGDSEFMEKAEERIIGLVTRTRAMVFASHSPDLIRRFCNRILVLNHGEVLHFGEPGEVLAKLAAAHHHAPPPAPT